MLRVGMLFLLLSSANLFADEFTHIKLNPQFEQLITRPPQKAGLVKKQAALSAKEFVDDEANEVAVSNRFREAVFGTSSTENLKTDWTSPFPTDGEESPLYAEIRRNLEAAHQDIGRSQVDQINLVNRQFNLGSQNFSGFSWQKPFGAIQVYADRQVTPNLFGSNWLVQDTFVFDIEASTFLEKLADAGLVAMNNLEIGAFAGITFKRVYTYYHYANSYQEGLSSDFTKLFLPFIQFNQMGMERMNDQEIMKREDLWSAKVGGLITSPSYYGFSLTGGVLAEVDYQQTTSAQSTHTEKQDAERYRLSVIGKKSAMAGATASLQLDFFKLIKLSLLSFDLNYEYAKSTEYNLAFTPPQWEGVKADDRKNKEVKSVLRGFGKVDVLEPYVVRLDESSSSSLEARGSILIWGRLQKNKTEQVRVIKDANVKVFFKDYSQSLKVVQNILSRLFSAVIYKLLKLPIGTTNAAMYSRNISLEFEATHPQASDPNISRIENSSQFSFTLTQSYEAARTDRWIDGRIKNDVIWFVDQFTGLPKDYKTIIRNEELRGPLRVESNLRVEKAGFDFLLNSNENAVWGKVAKVCGSKRASEWMDEAVRSKRLKKLQIGAEACVKKMGLKYAAFKTDYLANSLMPSLAKFKSFLSIYYKKSGNLNDLASLFGEENTFINGRLQATTSLGISFVTTFSAGQFRGLGVIDNFKRSTGARSPASIANE